MLDMVEVPMLEDLDAYYWQMAARGRLLLLDDGRTGLCTFFLLQDESEVHRFYCRPMGSTPADDPQGTLVYIDRLVLYVPCTRAVVRAIEQTIAIQHPQYTRALWYRPSLHEGPDRRYTLVRRR